VQQPIPIRTLVAICVAAFVLVAGLVLFVLWFGSRSRKKKGGAHENLALGISKSTSRDNVGFKGIPPLNPANMRSFASEQSSYYSQSTGRKPTLVPQHSRLPASDSLDQHKLELNPYRYSDEASFLPKQNFYSPAEMASMSSPSSNRPTTGPDTPNTTNQSPHAHAITRPYVIGSHPFASPGRGTPQGRPSIEHAGSSTIAISYPEQLDGQGLDFGGQNIFTSVGARPGYNAYGIESRQPITSLNARPSLESLRTLARKASIDQPAVSAATEFALGGPTAVGSRSRNDSTSSSHHRNQSGYGSSMYGGSIYGGSSKSGKDAGKEKLTKQEKAREMKAMDHLIAALDDSAEKDRKRKQALAAAAGLGDLPSPTGSATKRDTDRIDGSYPLPPANVFRAALASSAAGSMAQDDWVDDEEIERWRAR
jgi:hypothetical protein